MKKSNFALLSLIGLMLVGCQGKGNSDNSSNRYISQGGPTSSLPVSTSQPEKTSSTGQSSTSSQTSSSVYDTEWDRRLVAAMIEHLGGESGVLPYLDIGAKGTFVYEEGNKDLQNPTPAYLEIFGNNYKEDTLEKAKEVFDKTDGWTASITGNTLTATNTKLGIRVVLSGSLDDHTADLKAYYEGPFDDSKATDWKDSTKEFFTNYLKGHILPYFYIGTTDETISDFNNQSFIINGGNWNNLVLTLAENAFNQDNKDGSSWLITDKTEDSLTATKTYQDGYKVTVIVRENITYQSGSRNVELAISYDVPYVLPKEEDRKWPENVQAEMVKHFGFVLPYIYLGVDTGITTHWYEKNHELQLESNGKWNNSIPGDAQSLLSADKDNGWTISNVAATAYEDGYLKATATIHGDEYELHIKKDSLYGSVIEIYVNFHYQADHKATDWSADTKKLFQDNLGGYAFPYVYLGSDHEDAYFDKDQQEVVITGGTYDDQILTDLETALTNDSEVWNKAEWAIEKDKENKTLTASKEGTDEGLEVTFSYFDGAYSDFAKLEIRYKGIQYPSDEDAHWDDDTKAAIKGYLGGDKEIPYVYLGTNAPMPKNEGSYQLIGGDFNTKLLDSAVDYLTKGGAQYVYYDKSSEIVTGFYSYDDGTTAFLIVSSDSSGLQMALTIQKYDPVTIKTTGTWDATTQEALKDHFDNYPLPYFDLGSTTPEGAEEDPDYALNYGAVRSFNAGYLLNAAKVLSQNGFEVQITNSGNDPVLTAKKEENTSLYKVTIQSASMNENLEMVLHIGEAFIVPTGEDAKWDDATKQSMDTNLWGTDATDYIPYFYTGARKLTEDYTNEGEEVDFTGGEWNSQVLPLAEKAFNSDNTVRKETIKQDSSKAWTLTYDLEDSSAENEEGALVATRTSDDGTHQIEVRVFENYGSAAVWIFYRSLSE